jgi:hypothetical protein
MARRDDPISPTDNPSRQSDIRSLAPEREARQPEIDELMRRFYAVISFPEGGAPDWQGMEDLFSSRARITRVTPEGVDYLDFAGFRNLAEELIEVGAFTSFFEQEVARRTDRFGNVLHMASAYLTKVAPEARDYIERGVNSLQWIREGGQWRIVSLCWDVAAPFNQVGLKPLGDDGTTHG